MKIYSVKINGVELRQVSCDAGHTTRNARSKFVIHSSIDLVRIAPNVFDATPLFEARHCAVFSSVKHPVHGIGRVRERDGHWCIVDFYIDKSAKLDQLPPEEWPDCNPLNVVSVNWTEAIPHKVRFQELTVLAEPSVKTSSNPFEMLYFD